MKKTQIQALTAAQRRFFATGATLDPGYRVAALRRLRAAVRKNEGALQAALRADLGKSGYESYLCEVGLALSELTYMIKHTPALARARRVPTPLTLWPGRSYVRPGPYGTVLVMSPWNYPVLLTLDPLTDALAAGNTVIVKPSAYAPRTGAALAELIGECFPPEYVAAVTGGREENKCLLDQRFDHIFFTGSAAVGRTVMARAAEHLTPVTLELGGKSPCIVDATADLPLAARRIVFGKFLNCGQTCVAPDYILCAEGVKDALLAALKAETARQFGAQPLKNPDYGRIVNEKHFDRLLGLLGSGERVVGGGACRESLRIEPTILDKVSWDSAAMGEEIFGPILPVLTYRSLDEAVERVEAMPRPLALYIFSRDRAAVERVLSRCRFGGGCVNDTVIHLATSRLPFGGVGDSGMGSYHGRAGFETFSHQKSIVDKAPSPDLPLRYQPYRPGGEKLLRRFLK